MRFGCQILRFSLIATVQLWYCNLKKTSNDLVPFQVGTGIWKRWFLRRRENQSTRRKPLRAKARTNNKLNPHMALMIKFKPRPHWWKVQCTTTSGNLLHPISRHLLESGWWRIDLKSAKEWLHDTAILHIEKKTTKISLNKTSKPHCHISCDAPSLHVSQGPARGCNKSAVQ